MTPQDASITSGGARRSSRSASISRREPKKRRVPMLFPRVALRRT